LNWNKLTKLVGLARHSVLHTHTHTQLLENARNVRKHTQGNSQGYRVRRADVDDYQTAQRRRRCRCWRRHCRQLCYL